MAERKVSHKVSFTNLQPPVIVEYKDPQGVNRFRVSEVPPTQEYNAPTEESSESSDTDPQIHSNADTHVSRYAKTLSQLTEALPKFEHYRNADSLGGPRRPGIEVLRHGVSDEVNYQLQY